MKTKMLITGGARSGKSRFGQETAAYISPEGRVLYVATARVWDEEMFARVQKHKDSRPSSWDTYEGYEHLGEKLLTWGEQYETVLIDCVTMLLTNGIFDRIGSQDPDTLTKAQIHMLEQDAEATIRELIRGIAGTTCNVLLITNELGSGVVPERLLGRVFRDMAGRANQQLAASMPEVCLMVSGLPLMVKGELP